MCAYIAIIALISLVNLWRMDSTVLENTAGGSVQCGGVHTGGANFLN